MKSDINEKLSKIFHNFPHPSSLMNYTEFCKQIKKRKLNISEKEILKWIQAQEVYTLHRERKLKFPRLKYNVTNMDDLWQIDLMDMQNIAKHNKNHRYILAIIDCFSKFGWCIAIKNKTSECVIKAFEILFKKTNRRPIHICSDQGREFVSN